MNESGTGSEQRRSRYVVVTSFNDFTIVVLKVSVFRDDHVNESKPKSIVGEQKK